MTIREWYLLILAAQSRFSYIIIRSHTDILKCRFLLVWRLIRFSINSHAPAVWAFGSCAPLPTFVLVKSLQLITFLQLTALRNLMVTEWCVCFIFSELPPHWGPTTLWLFLWWQINDRVPHPVRKSHAPAWCCSRTEQARGVFVSAQWEWTKAMPRRWWEIRYWSTLERSGVVLRVLPSRNRTRVWC